MPRRQAGPRAACRRFRLSTYLALCAAGAGMVMLATVPAAAADRSGASMNDDRFAHPRIATLATAAERGDIEAMRREMQAVHPDTPGSDGTTLLVKAIADGNVVAAQALLEGGADPNRPGKGGETPVH